MSQKSAVTSVSPPTIDPAPSTPVDTREVVCAVAHEVMGTIIDMNVPLMSAGLDSLAAVRFASVFQDFQRAEDYDAFFASLDPGEGDGGS